jgi:hypothetical protein
MTRRGTGGPHGTSRDINRDRLLIRRSWVRNPPGSYTYEASPKHVRGHVRGLQRGPRLCPACQQIKPRRAFNRRPDARDGRRRVCRTCQAKQACRWAASPQGRASLQRNERLARTRHPEKHHARVELRKAIARGEVIRGPCEIGAGCKGRIEAHHDDYSQPLKARWFCQKHHLHHAHGGRLRPAVQSA